jgi:hypothetical protein
MIREPIFEDPNSLVSMVQRAEARRAAGDRIPDIELATIIERHREKALPLEITEYLIQHFRGEIRGIKGPKFQSDAEKDFRFGPAHNLYHRALPVFEYISKRRKRLPLKRRIKQSAPSPQNQPRTPSDYALDYVLKKLKKQGDLQTVSRRSLANAFSERQRKIEGREFPDDELNEHPTDKQEAGTSP